MKYVLIFLLFGVIFLAGCIGQSPTGKLTEVLNETIDQSEPTTITTQCIPNWQCSEWGSCVRTGKTSGSQSRTCTDLNNCNTTIGKPSESQSCSLPPTATKEPSEMALELSDFPTGQNWTLKSREERIKSDVSKGGQSLGWIKGYQVVFTRIGTGQEIWGIPTDISVIGQAISIYPIENISKVLSIPEYSTENGTYDELSKPNIGDDSRAFRITTKDESGTESRSYMIEFVKKDVYIGLVLYGPTTDYELLKDLAKKAESKIS